MPKKGSEVNEPNSIFYAKEKSAGLLETLKLVNNWVQWAELKHGAFLAINSAVIMGLITMMYSNQIDDEMCIHKWFYEVFVIHQNNELVKWVCVVAAVLLAIAVLISALSFWPKTGKLRKKECKNVLFFGDAANVEPDEYLLIYKNFCSQTDSYEKMLSEEIVYNSKVATRKYTYFRASLIVSTVAYLLLGATIVILQCL